MREEKLSYQETAAFCHDLALLVQAGIGLSDGVFLMSGEEKSGAGETFKRIGESLDQGKALSAALQECERFPAYVIGLVSVGEKTGRLEESLFSLAEYYEERSRVNRMLWNALAYPLLILLLMLAVVGVLLIQVMPVFDKVYQSLGSRLTGAAAGLLQLGYGLKAALPALFVILAVGILAGILFACVSTLRQTIVSFFKKKWGDKGLLGRLSNAQFARALAMGLTSGLTLEESLELAGMLLCDTPGAKKRCDSCIHMLQEGAELSAALGDNGFLQAAQSRMLAIGMRGGNGDRVMTELADRMMEQAGEALDSAVAKVEPTMVLAASVLVGMILLAVLLPLTNIMAAIG